MQKLDRRIASIQNNKEENLGTFAKSFFHYLLTASLIPSQRKVTLNNTEIDIVIPELKTLKTKPHDSLIICFPKTSNMSEIKQKLLKLEKIQPMTENIWFIMTSDFKFNGRIYEIKERNSSFSRSLDDINEFLMTINQTRFKIFKTQLN